MTRTNKYFIGFIIGILLFAQQSISQPSDDQTSKQLPPDAKSFKNWLAHSWLKNEIIFDTIEQADKKIYLTLRFECDSNCTARWNALKSAFDTSSSISFEFYIWNKANFHIETGLPLILEIYNRTKPFEAPCFLRSIFYQDSLRTVKADCKDLGGKSYLDYIGFNPSFLMKKVGTSNKDKKAAQILDILFKMSERYFKSKGKDIAVIKHIVERDKIVFSVTNLRSEVLKNRNTIEKLQITIVCNLQIGQASFEVIMNGRYGSVRLKPISDKGYNDMEDDYKSELQLYVDEFVNHKVINWLK